MLASPFVVWAAAEISPEPPSYPLTLSECYALALWRSEEIAIQQEFLKETEGRFLQALSGLLPRASFAASHRQQDASGESAFKLKEVPERKFVFSQPLFSGFKEFAAMAGSRAERRQRTYEKVRAEQLLLVDVADAFYLLLEQREDLRALETIRSALLERLDELSARERLGRSRPSEVASAEAQLRRVEAEMERVRSQETIARQLLEFLTGLPRIEAITESAFAMPSLASEATYLAKADIRPDVRAAEEAWRVARHQVTIAQAKFWPSVGLESNYYTKRVGASEGVDWDVLLKVDVPIFQGGQNVGAVKESAAQARQARLRFLQTQRAAILDVRDGYTELRLAFARTDALKQALEAAEENYRLHVEDYRLNLVSTLDVLQALQELQDVRRDVIHVQHEAKRLYWRLQAAVGETL